MKLHIGSRRRAEGWVAFDAVAGPEVDFVGDSRNLSQFGSDSIEAIYASHVVEHIAHGAPLLDMLKEWHRVLAPGGTLYISVPDLDVLCWLFVRPGVSEQDKYMIMRMMFGGQMDAHDFHFVGLNWSFLSTYLTHAGFGEITRVQSLGIFNDTSTQQFAGVPISLNVTARKPSVQVVQVAG